MTLLLHTADGTTVLSGCKTLVEAIDAHAASAWTKITSNGETVAVAELHHGLWCWAMNYAGQARDKDDSR